MRLTSPRWAIIPTAGRGTRLAPATDSLPKALLPVGARPMVDWAIDEALASGGAELIVVVSPQHDALRRHVEQRAAEWPSGVGLHLVEQPRPAGLGEALLRCRPLTGAEPFGVVVPDNWFDAPTPALAQVAATCDRTALCSIGLVEVTAHEAPLLGNVGRVDLEALGGGDFRIRALADKAPGSFALADDQPVLRGCARYVLGPEFYEALEACGAPQDGEWDDVPAFQRLARAGRLAGGLIDGRLFDLGQHAGYRAAARYLEQTAVSDSGAERR